MKLFLYIFALGLCLPPLISGSSAGTIGEGTAGIPPASTDSLFHASLLLHFRQNLSSVEQGYMANSRTLERFSRLFSNSLSALRVDTVTVLSYTSPEGNTSYNLNLSHQRALAVKAYLLGKYPHLAGERILVVPIGENWEKLRELVVSDESVPDRDEVLHILDDVPDRERCKALLKKLNCGNAYRYIYKELFPQLRNASVCLVRMKAGISVPALVPAPVCAHSHSLKQEPAPKQEPTPKRGPAPGHSSARPAVRPAVRPLFSIKTNLLFDLAMSPNIELEFPLGRNHRWSLNAEWMFPWWLFDDDKYCLQVLSGGLEGRYWLGNRTTRRTLTGHFLGLYAGGGKYDLQWKTDGYQGEFYIASGISYGYAAPIARRLNLEFSIGIGLLRTNYEHYHAINNYKTLLWQNDGNYTWFGPTKLKISLVWLLGGKRKGGGNE